MIEVFPVVVTVAVVRRSAETGGTLPPLRSTQSTRHGLADVPGEVRVMLVAWVSAWSFATHAVSPADIAPNAAASVVRALAQSAPVADPAAPL